jgi:hypothetical protein
VSNSLAETFRVRFPVSFNFSLAFFTLLPKEAGEKAVAPWSAVDEPAVGPGAVVNEGWACE